MARVCRLIAPMGDPHVVEIYFPSPTPAICRAMSMSCARLQHERVWGQADRRTFRDNQDGLLPDLELLQADAPEPLSNRYMGNIQHAEGPKGIILWADLWLERFRAHGHG